MTQRDMAHLGCHNFLGGLCKKTGSRESLTFGILIDLIKHVCWHRHIDANAFDFSGRRFDQNSNTVGILFDIHYFFERGRLGHSFAGLCQSL